MKTNSDHTVWTVEVKAVSKVFSTKEQAQKYIDENGENLFKLKKLDVNPANLKVRQLQKVKDRLRIHEYCIENNIPLEQQVFYYNDDTSMALSVYFEIKTFCIGVFEPYSQFSSIPPEYKGRILDISCCHTYDDGDIPGKKYFTEYDDIDRFTKMLKEDGYERTNLTI